MKCSFSWCVCGCVCVCLFWWECFLRNRERAGWTKPSSMEATSSQPLKYSSWNIIFDFSFGHNQIITKYHLNVPLNFRPLDSVRQHSARCMFIVYSCSCFLIKRYASQCPSLLHRSDSVSPALSPSLSLSPLHISPFPRLTFDLIYQTFYLLQCAS